MATVTDGTLLFKFNDSEMVVEEQTEVGNVMVATYSLTEHPRLANIKRKASGKRSFTATDNRLAGEILETLMDEPELQAYL